MNYGEQKFYERVAPQREKLGSPEYLGLLPKEQVGEKHEV